MKLWILLAGLFMSALGARVSAAPDAAHEDDLWQRFVNPPAEARPFVRWWWNGNAVRTEEIIRELDILKAAGLGGVEINPIELPPTNLTPQVLPWLSPEWNQTVRQATRAAKERGMIADMIIGSGWPFGAEFLESKEWCQRVSVNRIALSGPKSVRLQKKELTTPSAQGHGKEETTRTLTSILFVRLAPEKIGRLEQVEDVTSKLGADGSISLEVPAGRHVIYCGYLERGYRSVAVGAPGASGPVLDHYNKAALLHFLNLMTDKLGPALGGKLGSGLRAMFCDSIELAGANWTDDMAAEFQKRRGYDLMPYLPFIVDFGRALPQQASGSKADALRDTLRRARYDYCLTLVELFHERFIETLNKWCHDNGTLLRYQAYGTPFLMGMEDAYRIPDIPESNNWLFSENTDSHGYLIWTNNTSSGGHQAGRPIISTEAHTNTRGVFRATLDMIKAADDFNFIMGINHSILHGFNYSPPEAGFPGWVRFGAYFSEHNTWWPYFKKWADYNARLSAVFQASKPVAQVAILYPSADMWSTNGLVRGPFHTQIKHAHHVWEWIQQNGAAADYVSETLLQKANYEKGTIEFGPMAYQALVVFNASTLQPATMAALERFAAAGGRIAFVGTVPERAPGLREAGEGDSEVQRLTQQLLAMPGKRVIQFPYPDTTASADNLDWTRRLLDNLTVGRSVNLAKPVPGVYMVHYRQRETDLLFFANTNTADAALKASLPETGRALWRWNPEDGTRAPYPATAAGELEIALRPHESLLLVSGPGSPAAVPQQKQEARAPSELAITGPWEATFQPAQQGKAFTRHGFKLQDLARSKEPQLNTFAGVITYRTRFTCEKEMTGNCRIDLGEVPNGVSEVTLNSKPLGVCWYGRHDYDIAPALRQGENNLEIKVTTTLFNHVRTLTDNPGATFALTGDPMFFVPGRPAKLRAPDPSGLVGPVGITDK